MSRNDSSPKLRRIKRRGWLGSSRPAVMVALVLVVALGLAVPVARAFVPTDEAGSPGLSGEPLTAGPEQDRATETDTKGNPDPVLAAADAVAPAGKQGSAGSAGAELQQPPAGNGDTQQNADQAQQEQGTVQAAASALASGAEAATVGSDEGTANSTANGTDNPEGVGGVAQGAAALAGGTEAATVGSDEGTANSTGPLYDVMLAPDGQADQQCDPNDAQCKRARFCEAYPNEIGCGDVETVTPPKPPAADNPSSDGSPCPDANDDQICDEAPAPPAPPAVAPAPGPAVPACVAAGGRDGDGDGTCDDQDDEDHNGLADVDQDIDGDGCLDSLQAAMATQGWKCNGNPPDLNQDGKDDQTEDWDGDGTANCCDPDLDGDGIPNREDLNPAIPTPAAPTATPTAVPAPTRTMAPALGAGVAEAAELPDQNGPPLIAYPPAAAGDPATNPMDARPPADPAAVQRTQKALSEAQDAVQQAQARVERLHANPDTAQAELGFAQQQLQEAKADLIDAQSAAATAQHPMTLNEQLDNTQSELGVYSLIPFAGTLFAVADGVLTAGRTGADIYYGDVGRIPGDLVRAAAPIAASWAISRWLGSFSHALGLGHEAPGGGVKPGLNEEPAPLAETGGQVAGAAAKKPIAELSGAALEDFPPGSGFSGAYDVKTGRFQGLPSGDTRLSTGEVPPNLVVRNGGHGDASELLSEIQGAADGGTHMGFTMILQEDGSIVVGWKSGQLNPGSGMVPVRYRQAILDAIAKATGRIVRSR